MLDLAYWDPNTGEIGFMAAFIARIESKATGPTTYTWKLFLLPNCIPGIQKTVVIDNLPTDYATAVITAVAGAQRGRFVFHVNKISENNDHFVTVENGGVFSYTPS